MRDMLFDVLVNQFMSQNLVYPVLLTVIRVRSS